MITNNSDVNKMIIKPTSDNLEQQESRFVALEESMDEIVSRKMRLTFQFSIESLDMIQLAVCKEART